jgi:beta-carotene hydroxylase
MRPRFTADYRTLIWLAGMHALAFLQYAKPAFSPWLLPLGLYAGFCAGVFSHNHNHCPTFKSRRANMIFANWLSIFYGYPVFAWIPTHNLNHHKFVNKAGDATITWRHTNANNWTVAWTYFFVSAYWQSAPIKQYIRKARRDNRVLFRTILTQYAVVLTAHVSLLSLALVLHGFARGMLVYWSAFGIPALFALWSMMFINYIQHVHCDPWSAHNHSRNFVSKLGNYLVFNAGLHAAHHENPGTHWSELPRAHAKIEAEIAPTLKQSSIWGFCFKAYLAGAFDPRFRTQQIGRPPFEPPDGSEVKLLTADVQAVDAGVNAAAI